MHISYILLMNVFNILTVLHTNLCLAALAMIVLQAFFEAHTCQEAVVLHLP